MCNDQCEHPAQSWGDRIVDSQTPQLNLGVASRTGSAQIVPLVARRMNMSTMTRNFLLFLLVITSTGLLYAQGGAYGTILGTVADNSGAVVANASVDVTNTATNVTNHVQTSSSGDYTVPYLQPGTYRVTVQAQGFQKSITDGVILVVAQQERVNVAMKPGAVTESVQVEASGVAL